MIKNIRHKFFSHLPLLLVIAVGVIVCASNYKSQSFLSGWDTLHPEFNLSLYTERVIFGAWQSHQGLGAPASQAHLAELPRLPFLWALTTFLPLHLVRYIFMMSMYVTGGIGIYLFIKYTLDENKKDKLNGWAATGGALFYLLNLGTLQHFYVPLEMFAVHFASLGFILLTLTKSLKQGGFYNYFWFFFVQVFSSSSAHTATLFYMYQAIIFLYGLLLMLSQPQSTWRTKATRFILVALLTLAAHVYWLGPNLYYVLSHSEYVQEAKISRLFSNEAFWQNQAFGQLTDVLILKNFLFNWNDYNFAAQKFIPLLDEWESHLSQAGYIFVITGSVLAVLGILLHVSTLKKQSVFFATCFFLVPIFFLINLNFPFTTIFRYIQQSSSLFEEALRFPFTKFSILFIFALSIGYSFSIKTLLTSLKGIFRPHTPELLLVTSLILVSSIALPISIGWPMLNGSLISPTMRIHYPPDYFELFDWAKTQSSDKRIAKFPINTFWGWNYYHWPDNGKSQGYQGAGFLWFGLPQPLMDREFDRWVKTNEFFYYEIAHSQYAGDQASFNQTLEKYNISFLLYDHSVINSDDIPIADYQRKFETLVRNNSKIELLQTIGQIDVYQVNIQNPNLIYSPQVRIVGNSPSYTRKDPIFQQLGNYVQDSDASVTFPFVNLTAERLVNVESAENSVIVTSPDYSRETIVIPAWSSYNELLPVKIDTNITDQQLFIEITPSYPEITIGNITLDLTTQLASPSVTIATDLPHNNSADVFLLQFEDTFYEIPFNADQTTIAWTYFNVDQPNTIQIYPAFLSEGGVLEVNDSSTQVTIQPSEISNILLPETVIAIQPNEITEVKIDNHMSPDERVLEWYEHKDASLSECSNNVGYTDVRFNEAVFSFRSNNKGIACEKFLFTNIEENQQYLLRADSKNIQGMPAKILVNEIGNRHRYLEEILDSDNGIHFYAILDERQNTGLEIDVISISFGSIMTENELSNLQLFAVPLDWLSNIRFTNAEIPTRLDPIQITETKTIAPHLYIASVKSSVPKGPLVLSESYDKGWIAFAMPPNLQVFNHTIYNGWANSWFIPEGEYQVVILYWPQFMSYFGYMLLGSVVIFFCAKRIYLHKKS